MAKLVQLTNSETNENIYAKTPVKAIVNADGSNVSSVNGILKSDGKGNITKFDNVFMANKNTTIDELVQAYVDNKVLQFSNGTHLYILKEITLMDENATMPINMQTPGNIYFIFSSALFETLNADNIKDSAQEQQVYFSGSIGNNDTVYSEDSISLARYDKLTNLEETVDQMVIVHPNLIKNWYFGNPVNQRGKTSYAGTGYGVDMWYTTGASLSMDVTAEGVKLYRNDASSNPAWAQALETDAVGQTVTISMLYKGNGEGASLRVAQTGGIVTLSNVSDWTLVQKTFALEKWGVGTLQNRAIVAIQAFESLGANPELYIKAIKLELGEQQTLAHQENGAWVLNEIPNYAEELLKCQRYFYKPPASLMTYGYLTGSKRLLTACVNYPVQMRTTPVMQGDTTATHARLHTMTGSSNIDVTATATEFSGSDIKGTYNFTTDMFNTNDYYNNTPAIIQLNNVQLSAEL